MNAQEMLIFELTALLSTGNLKKALPLAETATRRHPKNAQLASFYIIALCQTGQELTALRFYHDRLNSVSEPELLTQSAAMGWMRLGLNHLSRFAMKSIAYDNPAAFAQMEADCQRQARRRGVTEEQLLFEDRARESYLLGDYADADWLERYPQSGALRAVLAAIRYQQGRLQEGLEICRFEPVCPALIFQEVKLQLALGHPARAGRAAHRLARYRSRDEQELLAQLQALLLVDQNKALLRVAGRSRLKLKNPKIQLCLASACFAEGHLDKAAHHLSESKGFQDPGEYQFNQMALESGDPDLGRLRAFVILKLFTRELLEQSRKWMDVPSSGPAPTKILRDVQKFLEGRRHLLKLTPWIWTYADAPQRYVASLFLAAFPEDRWLRRRFRKFLTSSNDMPRTKQLLLQSATAPSGVYDCDGEYQVALRIEWDPSWSPDCSGKAREMLRSVGQLMAQKRYSDAETMILRALEFAPDSPDLLYQQAICLRFLKREEECLIRVDRVLAIRPDHPAALLTKAGSLARKGHLSEARQVWRSVERRKKLWVGTMGEFFLSYYQILSQTRPRRAQAWLQHWRQLQPGHPFQELAIPPR